MDTTEVAPPQPIFTPKVWGFWDYVEFYTREAVAVLFWVYVLTKVFIFDLDIYLVNHIAPNLLWVINYKFLILIGTIAILWLFTRNQRMLVWSSYVLLYPLVILCWKIPRFLWKKKSWTLAIAFLNVVLSFFKAFKFNFIIFAISLVAAIAILVSHNTYILWVSVLTLPIILAILLGRRFISVFKPSTLYEVHSKIVSVALRESKKGLLPEPEVRELAVAQMSETQLQKWSGNLQLAVLLNRGCYFFAMKLNDYRKSGANIVFYIADFTVLAVGAVLFFGLANFGLYKIAPSNFSTTPDVGFFDFLYYSFNAIFTSAIDEVRAVSDIARTANMLEVLFAFLFGGLLITLLFNVRKEKDETEIERAVSNIKAQGDEMEAFISNEYKLSVVDDITELEKMKAGMIKIIYFLSKQE